MQTELFTWSRVVSDRDMLLYYDVTLKQKLGKYDIGSKFSSIEIMLSSGELTVYIDDKTKPFNIGLCETLKFKLVVD